MRTLVTIMAVVLLMTAVGCNDEQMTAWVLTSPNTDLQVQLGMEIQSEDPNSIGKTEFGLVAVYETASEIPWGPQPDRIGAYVDFFLTQLVQIEDSPQASPIKAFLDDLNAQPYAGLAILVDVDGEQRRVKSSWHVGTLFTLDKASNIGLAVQYADGPGIETGGVYVGGRGRFFQF